MFCATAKGGDRFGGPIHFLQRGRGGRGSSGPDTRFCPLLLGLGSLRDEAGERNDPGKHVGLQERRRAGRGGGGGGGTAPR